MVEIWIVRMLSTNVLRMTAPTVERQAAELALVLGALMNRLVVSLQPVLLAVPLSTLIALIRFYL